MCRWYLVICAVVLACANAQQDLLEFGSITSDGKLIDLNVPRDEKTRGGVAQQALKSFHQLIRTSKKVSSARSDDVVSSIASNEVTSQLTMVTKLVARNLRKDMFDHYSPAAQIGDLRLAGSLVRYMGRIQVALPGNRWGAVCADGFDVTDALVVCRQLGFTTEGVVVRKGNEFGGTIGPGVMSNVNCQGRESRLDKCKADTWDGTNSLKCNHAAGVICGCPLNSDPSVVSRCSFDTTFPQDKMYCRFNCKPGMVLSGSGLRRCSATQTWSGSTPRCFPEKKACQKQPCMNGGECKDLIHVDEEFLCVCSPQFRGKFCEIRVNWSCGKSKTSSDFSTVRPQLRIIGGRKALRSSWPWLVQLRDKDEVFCSGTIVSPLWIITAAHCLQLKSIKSGHNSDVRWTVVAGQYRRVKRERESIVANIVFFILNDYTYADIPRNDIAMIRLKSSLSFGKNIRPICLPTSKQDNPLPGEKCWIVGWGSYTLSHQLPTVTHEGDIPIISNEECRKINRAKFRNYNALEDNMICAGYISGGVDACRGDSGGPLMCRRNDGDFYLSGVTSWGYGCAEPNQPGIYTRVSHYLDWIDRYIHM